MRRNVHEVSLGMLLLLVIVTPVFSWESDLHYGLTKWLAVKAGFSLGDAETIAWGTEDPDKGDVYPAPNAVFRSACLGNRDEQGSRFVQDNHFPSYGPVPGTPKQRAVIPGDQDNGANVWVRKEIAARLADVAKATALRMFGLSLHPLEDSWSHQGEPDTPALCWRDLAWAHPKQRDGFTLDPKRRHNADLTYLHVEDAVATAKKVYGYMQEYLRSHPEFGQPSSIEWSQLEPEVRKFAKADTKAAKRRWFGSDSRVPFMSYADQTFLDRINLPDDGKKTGSLPTPLSLGRLVPAAQTISPVPVCVNDFVQMFLMRWIVEQQIEEALKFVDVQSVRKRLSQGKDGQMTDPQTLFALWLIEDHGLVNKLGHGLPEEGIARLYGALGREPFPFMRFRTLSQAIRAPGTTAPFFLVALPEEGQAQYQAQYAAMFQFRHAPRDELILLIAEKKETWTIVGIDWITQ